VSNFLRHAMRAMVPLVGSGSKDYHWNSWQIAGWIIRSYGASVAALLLVTAIGSTLLHWHSDWNDQRCQLCHVRHLPSALGPVAEGPAYPVLTERDWLADNPAYELESFFVRFSSRAPPRPTSFTVS